MADIERCTASLPLSGGVPCGSAMCTEGKGRSREVYRPGDGLRFLPSCSSAVRLGVVDELAEALFVVVILYSLPVVFIVAHCDA